jgi:chemotaxis-related protein WspD
MTPARKSSFRSAAAELLARDLDVAERREITGRVAQKPTAFESLTRSALAFRLNQEWLGMDARAVEEVTEVRTIHSLPSRRTSLVRGLANVRGELTICVSMQRLFDLSAPDPTDLEAHVRRRLIVISHQGQRLAFEASEVFGTVRFNPQQLGPLPATVANAISSFSVGLLSWRDRTIGILDTELAVRALNRYLA